MKRILLAAAITAAIVLGAGHIAAIFATQGSGAADNAAFIASAPGPDEGRIVPSGLVGDGRTDNAKAIQDALDQARTAGGGTVHLPKGTFVLGQHVKVYDNTRIIGSGMGVTVIKPATKFKDAADKTYGCLFVSHGGSNLHFSDFTITGADQRLSAGAIHINTKDWANKKGDNQESNIIIQRVQMKDFWGRGIWFGDYAPGDTHSTTQITIRDCRFERLFNPSNPYEKVAEEFNDDGRMDAIFGLSAARKITIADNFFKDLSGNAIRGHGWYYTLPDPKEPTPDWMDIVITGNHIESTWMGIEFEGYLSGSRSIIANNTIKWTHAPGGTGAAISAGGRGLKITGNYIEQVERGGLEVGGTGILVEGNTIRISVQKKGTPPGGNKDFNKPTTIRTFAMFAATASQFSNNLLICDPVYDDGTVTQAQMWGISLAGAQGSTPPYDDGKSDVVSVLGNTFIGFTQRAIQCSNKATENVYIGGNVFRTRFARQDEPAILLWGHNWLIHDNVFDFSGARTRGSILRVHTGVQSDDARSLITRNTVIGDGWKIDASKQYHAYGNDYLSQSGLLSTSQPAAGPMQPAATSRNAESTP